MRLIRMLGSAGYTVLPRLCLLTAIMKQNNEKTQMLCSEDGKSWRLRGLLHNYKSVPELLCTSANINFAIGFEIVDMAKEDLSANDAQAEIGLFFSTISHCLNRDEGWKAYYSSEMEDIQLSQLDRTQLYQILQQERKAYDEATARNYDAASETMQQIADTCSDSSEKGWYLQEKARFLYRISHSESSKVQVSAFKMNTQLMKPRTGIAYNKLREPLNKSG